MFKTKPTTLYLTQDIEFSCPAGRKIVFSTRDKQIAELAAQFILCFLSDLKHSCSDKFTYNIISNSPNALTPHEQFSIAAKIEIIRNLLLFKKEFKNIQPISEEFKFNDKTLIISYTLLDIKKKKIVGLYADERILERALCCISLCGLSDCYTSKNLGDKKDLKEFRVFLHSSSGIKYWEGISSDEPRIPLTTLFRVEDCAKLLQEHNIAQFSEFDLDLYHVKQIL
jgi:hypothetical protein